MAFEPEIKAMQDVYAAVKGLDDNAKMRVISWVLDKFSLNGQLKNCKGGNTHGAATESDEEPIDMDKY